MITKIISGAQTGADRAGLDAGLALGLRVGGWIPKGRRTDEGPLSLEDMARDDLQEHRSSAYPPRTEQNVLESDGTVLFEKMNSPGCALTIKLCIKHNKPYLCNFHLLPPAIIQAFIRNHNIHALNVAGNRERTNPGIYRRTYDAIVEAFSEHK